MAPDDDPTVSDDERLLRRVPPQLIVWNENIRARQVSTGAFSNSSDGSGMSVSLAGVLKAACLPEENVIRGYDGFGLVAIKAGLARAQSQGVTRVPTETDPSHAEVVGKKTRAVKQAFKREATWIVCPAPPEGAMS